MLAIYEGYFKKSSKEASAYDFKLPRDIRLLPKSLTKLPLDTRVGLPPHTLGLISHRGSLPSKKGLSVITGFLDPDYTGVIFITIENHTNLVVDLKKGERIAQCAILPIWVDPNDSIGTRGESGSSGGYDGNE